MTVPDTGEVHRLQEEIDALRSVVRHWHNCVRREDDPPMSEWDDIDWADSGWTLAEQNVLRAVFADHDPARGRT